MYGYRSKDTDNRGVVYSLANRTPSNALRGVITQLDKLPQEASVLDLGCGDGVLETHIDKRRYTFTSLDIEPAAIHTVQKIFTKSSSNDQTILGDITKLKIIPELRNKKFNVIVSWRVFHGISPEHYKDIFEQVHHLLKPGSSFFISVASNEDWKATALGNAYDPDGINDCSGVMFRDFGIDRTNPFPVHFFSPEELVQLGEDNGFVLKTISTFQEPSGYTHLKGKMNTYLYAHFIAK